jgi:hypothetical protein
MALAGALAISALMIASAVDADDGSSTATIAIDIEASIEVVSSLAEPSLATAKGAEVQTSSPSAQQFFGEVSALGRL